MTVTVTEIVDVAVVVVWSGVEWKKGKDEEKNGWIEVYLKGWVETIVSAACLCVRS